jgi:hypothetical protein
MIHMGTAIYSRAQCRRGLQRLAALQLDAGGDPQRRAHAPRARVGGRGVVVRNGTSRLSPGSRLPSSTVTADRCASPSPTCAARSTASAARNALGDQRRRQRRPNRPQQLLQAGQRNRNDPVRRWPRLGPRRRTLSVVRAKLGQPRRAARGYPAHKLSGVGVGAGILSEQRRGVRASVPE